MLQDYRICVTGGAGFLGSHLTEVLLKRKCTVTVLDNFSSGSRMNLKDLPNRECLDVVEEDLKRPCGLEQIVGYSGLIFHFAANPEVRVGETSPSIHFEENVLATFNLLEAVRRARRNIVVVFTSTSTVYGEAVEVPTPETYGPLIPISTYGASKLACEALIVSYAHTFKIRALILRLANIVGSRSNHGVIVDFIKKIHANPNELEILGDGSQDKSYMHVDDFVDAVTHLTTTFLRTAERVEIYNLGSEDRMSVKKIARTVADELGHQNTHFRFTGGIDGGRGWKGDVKVMQLSIQKLLDTNWKPKCSSSQAVKLAARELSKEIG